MTLILDKFLNFTDDNKTLEIMSKEKKISKVINKLLNNTDIYLDKIERHGEIQKKFKFNIKTNLIIKKESKPQEIFFKEKIDNSPKTEFIPKITSKKNSTKKLDPKILEAQKDPLLFFKKNKNLKFQNPYSSEIRFKAALDLNTLLFSLKKIIKKEKIMGNNFEYIDTVPSLKKMIKDIKLESFITIDLEHHSERSFQGFTCLIQLSTPRKDFIIDTIILRSELQQLNEIFTNPNIVKILHGCDSDVVWLQKDFGVYLVNVIDTYQIAKTFRKNNSLGSFLREFCGVFPDKSLQRSDWRVRPLPANLLEYARIDTHYLFWVLEAVLKQMILFCKNSGLDSDELFRDIWENTKNVVAVGYQKPRVFSNAFFKYLKNYQGVFDERQNKVFRDLWEWRNLYARKMDESEFFILKPRTILKLCEKNTDVLSYLNILVYSSKITNDIYKELKNLLLNHEKKGGMIIEKVGKINNNDFTNLKLKEKKSNTITKKLKFHKLRDLNFIFSTNFNFNVKKSKNLIYNTHKENENENKNPEFRIKNLIKKIKIAEEEKTINPNNLENSGMIEENDHSNDEIEFDQKNDLIKDPTNGIDLLKNLSSLNISEAMKKKLIENVNKNDNRIKKEKNPKEEEHKSDMFNKVVQDIGQKMKNNFSRKNNIYSKFIKSESGRGGKRGNKGNSRGRGDNRGGSRGSRGRGGRGRGGSRGRGNSRGRNNRGRNNDW